MRKAAKALGTFLCPRHCANEFYLQDLNPYKAIYVSVHRSSKPRAGSAATQPGEPWEVVSLSGFSPITWVVESCSLSYVRGLPGT